MDYISARSLQNSDSMLQQFQNLGHKNLDNLEIRL